MLKGHADIYLMDAKTGKVVDERHEDNIVTNAVQDLLSMNPFGARAAINGEFPLALNSLGGVYLFPETITESASNYYARGQWPTGYANTEADPNGEPRRGNFNPNESYATSNGYRLVWDFGTADANGDISCVCLTRKNGGAGFELSDYVYQNYTLFSAGSLLRFFDLSNAVVEVDAYHSNAFYKANFTDGTYKVNSLTLMKWDANPHRQQVNRTFEFRNPTTIYVDLDGLHISSATYRSAVWDESGLRILSENYDNGGYDTYYVTTIGWDGTTSEVAIPKGDMVNLSRMNKSMSHAHGNWCYLQTYVYEDSQHKYGFYAVDLTNISNIQEIESSIDYAPSGGSARGVVYTCFVIPYGRQQLANATSSQSIYWIAALDDGKLLFETTRTISGSDSAFLRKFAVGHIGPYIFSKDVQTSIGSYISIGIDNTYLATINNLATPITKTADRTLKIVYTLTES